MTIGAGPEVARWVQAVPSHSQVSPKYGEAASSPTSTPQRHAAKAAAATCTLRGGARARRGAGGGPLGPGGAGPLPGITEGRAAVAAEEHDAAARGVIGHCVPVPRRGAGCSPLGPGRAVSLPGVTEVVGGAVVVVVAAEE